MAAKKGKVTINGRFPAGTKVELHDRGAADVFNGGPTGDAVATATTDKHGETTFEALPGSYFAVATVKDWNHITQEHEDRVRVVDVSIPAPPAPIAAEPAPAPPVGPEPPAPSFNAPGRIVMGARSSVDGDVTYEPTQLVDEVTGMVSTFATPVGVPTPSGDIPKVGVPQPRQEDHRDTELASSTLTGAAIAPKVQAPQQGDTREKPQAGQKLEQASDTERGFEAPAREVVRQEDYRGPQASDTPTGTAYPVGQAETPDHPQDQPPAIAGKGGSSQPAIGTREPEPAPKDAEKVQTEANKSAANKAAAKVDSSSPLARSAADTGAGTTPATDARGVEHVEAPETIGSPEADETPAPRDRSAAAKKAAATRKRNAAKKRRS